jgi:uncharacterized protein YidB (DUF937 family)
MESKDKGAEMKRQDPNLDSVIQELPSEQKGLISNLFEMFGGSTSGGGLSGLVKAFQQGGLQGAISSWIGTGANKPVDAQQIESAVGRERLTQLASRFGMTAEQASASIAQYLPTIVDRMTPEGKLPEDRAA